jgi:predicted MPP superfamily phosphohydrolase
MISRRQFLRSAVIGSATLGAGLATYDLKTDSYTSHFMLEDFVLPVAGLPSAFEGYRIGFLTDIHLGTWVPESWIQLALEELTRRSIDLLLLGGDYILVNESSIWDTAGIVRNPRFAGLEKKVATQQIYSAFAQCVSQFSFPDGMLAVVGNHEHWNMFPAFESTMQQYPSIRVLRNVEASIRRGSQELVIFGVDDYLTGIPLAPPQRDLRDGQAKRIILSHNPDYLTAVLPDPEHQFSFALCGHTHGGQVVLPLLGPIAAQVVDRRFVSGAQPVGDGRVVYTSRGLGVVGLPFRFNCPAEVTVCQLTRA